LRGWQDSDLEPFASMNADPRVMEFFPEALSRDASKDLYRKIRRHLDEKGFGLWVVEIPGEATFAGFTGLSTPAFESYFTPCIEIGWRLCFAFQGKGYATEAARAALRIGFDDFKFSEIVSFTVASNKRSRRVMEKIGMVHDGETFLHPSLPEGHPLSLHVLYRKKGPEDFANACTSS